MSRIFISYRRSDSQDATGRIHDRLDMYFGPDRFLCENPGAQSGVNGPLLFDWARRKHHVNQPEELSTATILAAKEIRAALRTRKAVL